MSTPSAALELSYHWRRGMTSRATVKMRSEEDGGRWVTEGIRVGEPIWDWD